MRPAGRKAFEARAREGTYSYEQRSAVELNTGYQRQFRANKKAWEYFRTRAAWYRKTAAWWVISAKREETRLGRLARLIDDSAHGRTIPPLTRPAKPAKRQP